MRRSTIVSSLLLTFVVLGCDGGRATSGSPTKPAPTTSPPPPPRDDALDEPAVAPSPPKFTGRYGIVIHGGAGTIDPDKLSPEREAEYRAKLREAVDAGYAVLDEGGASLDAVQAAILVMEDSPLFNAGKGAVFTNAGTNEMDASIMDGATGNAGAVAGVSTVRNPILGARAVMEHSPHVMLGGRGAEEFCREQGLAEADAAYFRTEERFEQLQRAKAREATELDHGSTPGSGGGGKPGDEKHGTVGAVALDKQGHLAAGTSTGGMTNKRWGRIGDSPIIGAGTFADDDSCAVSGTGHGEYFIREAVAHSICARVELAGQPLAKAADAVVLERLKAIGGDGGVIAMTVAGDPVTPFNTAGMYRAVHMSDGETSVAIWATDHPRETAAPK